MQVIFLQIKGNIKITFAYAEIRKSLYRGTNADEV